MKKRLNKKLLGILMTGLLMLQGCVIVINQPTPEEKQLMQIQNQVSDQVKTINTKVESGSYSSSDLDQLISGAEQNISNSLQTIDKLQLPDRAKDVAEKTKIYLESAQRLYGQMKALLSDFNSLKAQASDLTNKAETEVQKQLVSAQKGLTSFQNQLNDLAQNLNQASQQITKK